MAVDDTKARVARCEAGPGWAAAPTSMPATAEQLDEAIRAAVSAPYQVFDQAGELVGSGTVGGAAVKLPPGTYRVVVLQRAARDLRGHRGGVGRLRDGDTARAAGRDAARSRTPRARRAGCTGTRGIAGAGVVRRAAGST